MATISNELALLALADRCWGPPRPLEREEEELAPATRAPWYVLACEVRQEATAEVQLKARGIPAYCPQEPKSIRQNYHKRRIIMRPMLTGYILAAWNGTPKQWRRIHGVPGARRILKVNDRPANVPDAVITYLKQKEDDAREQFKRGRRASLEMKIGDLVQIIEHSAFSGLFGRISSFHDAKNRIRLLVDLFGRLTPLEVSAKQVRAL